MVTDSKFDEMERDNLQKAISQVEAAIAASTSGTRANLGMFLQNARARIDSLDKKLNQATAERESKAREQVAVQVAAQQETALSVSEKETFSGFLRKPFFTKADFGSLEQFYEKTWDRLSESGKDQMSQRIWGGIRQNEFTFTELPKVVQEKEADRVYAVLKKRDSEAAKVPLIPRTDRDDFIRAYESGDLDNAKRVLERDSFKQNMFRAPMSDNRRHAPVERSFDVSRAEVESNLEAMRGLSEVTKTVDHNTTRDLSGLGLEGVTLTDAHSPPSSADLPNAKATEHSQRQSTRGS